MLSRQYLWPITLLHLCLGTIASPQEIFDEKLSLNTLQDGKVASKFTFTTLLNGASPRDPRTLHKEDDSQHYTLFPLALGQILREYGVTELHLTLNAGKWNYDRWGYPEEKGVGTGAELWAWMGDGANTTIDERWKGLRNSLSGLFCASIASLDELRTTSPSQSFAPEGALPDWDLPHQLRHASLPSEHVCTENLTPFLKLLPCKSLSGIAALLNPHKLFDADWHGMGVHVLWRGDEGVEVQLTFQTVSDPLRITSRKSQDWSLQSLFDRTVDRTCPVAETSQIFVTLPNRGLYSISPEPSVSKNGLAIYDVKSVNKPLNVELKWPEAFNYPLSYSSGTTPFSVKRTLTGSSQALGRLSVAITNHRTEAISVLYLETMPWLLQFFLHTLEARIDGVLAHDIISDLTYIPSVPHSRPTTFQALLHLPPKKTVQIKMDVTKAFLRYTEHPPDAQRGWDLPPAILVPVERSQNDSSSFTPLGGPVYTSTLLVDLATPDFSMPYNVIIFTCTLIAGLFGTVFNILTRKWVVVRLAAQP
ncbi:Gpi16 subunit, GPI transamidase component [Pholiota conissans]|uniref:Gpi16 subunit, GPI transamidase component n=1 Tax=Pholiota conissans TaxID=109636 RepID=A0A9P6CVX4_9AGAR|nr:Gpi16 subunit, GPI transamidase component [Pholiota conissans]